MLRFGKPINLRLIRQQAIAVGVGVGLTLGSSLVSPSVGVASLKKPRVPTTTTTTTTVNYAPVAPGREACVDRIFRNGLWVGRGGPPPHVIDVPSVFIGDCLDTEFFAYPNEEFVFGTAYFLTASMTTPKGNDPGSRPTAEFTREGNRIRSVRFLRPGSVTVSYRKTLGSRKTGAVKTYRATIQVRPMLVAAATYPGQTARPLRIVKKFL